MSADSQIKKIIIIGATSGIGRKMAELYAADGNIVGITGRRKELLDEIENIFPGKIKTECFDVTGNENIEKLKALIEKTGGMDILVYSSGVGEPSKKLEWRIDKPVVDTHVNGFIEISNWSFNFFVTQGEGHLVVISSIAANRGNSWAPAYAAAKAFQTTYYEGLAIKAERIKKEIMVTAIEPGFVNTAMAHGGDKMFWIVPVEKAARQIIAGIKKKKRKLYVSKRWWLIAKLMRWMPYWIYKRFL